MKVLYISTVVSTINTFLVPHIEMLVEEGHQVDIASNLNVPVDNKLLEINCSVHEIDFQRSPFKNNFSKLSQQLKSIIIEESYDLIHTHTPIASAISRYVCKDISGVNVIYTAHGFHFYKGAPIKNWLIYYPIEKYLSKYTDYLITMNEEDFQVSKKFNIKYTTKVPGVGIDLRKMTYSENHVKKLKDELKIKNISKVLLSIGEINENKNHKVVIEAISKLDRDDIIYIVCGAGQLKEKLLDFAKEQNVENRIYFVGKRNDINEFLKIADVFIFPSFREGLSRSIMEAMAMGLPIIASKIRGNRDLINENEGGYLFNPNSSSELAKLINKLIDNENVMNKFGKFNSNKIQEFEIRIVLERMKKIYNYFK